MYKEQSYTAVIPVRAGSNRLKDKNIYPFNGSTLLEHKISQLQCVDFIDEIVVSSDSEIMLEMASKRGVTTHKRSWEYCDEKTKTFGEVVEHICSDIHGDNIIWATVTSPLVVPEVYKKAIKLYSDAIKNKFDSLLTVEAFQKYILTENGPLNYSHGKKHVPSQELEKYYFKTNGIMISPRLKMIEWQYLYGSKPFLFEIDKVFCADVDDLLDMAQASAWLELLQKKQYTPKL